MFFPPNTIAAVTIITIITTTVTTTVTTITTITTNTTMTTIITITMTTITAIDITIIIIIMMIFIMTFIIIMIFIIIATTIMINIKIIKTLTPLTHAHIYICRVYSTQHVTTGCAQTKVTRERGDRVSDRCDDDRARKHLSNRGHTKYTVAFKKDPFVSLINTIIIVIDVIVVVIVVIGPLHAMSPHPKQLLDGVLEVGHRLYLLVFRQSISVADRQRRP
jgi:hypothetical protein